MVFIPLLCVLGFGPIDRIENVSGITSPQPQVPSTADCGGSLAFT